MRPHQVEHLADLRGTYVHRPVIPEVIPQGRGLVMQSIHDKRVSLLQLSVQGDRCPWGAACTVDDPDGVFRADAGTHPGRPRGPYQIQIHLIEGGGPEVVVSHGAAV